VGCGGLLATGGLWAAPSLLPPAAELTAGLPARFDLWFPQGEAAPSEVSVVGVLASGHREVFAVRLIEAGASGTAVYSGSVPPTWSGPVDLRLEGDVRAPFRVAVLSAGSPKSTPGREDNGTVLPSADAPPPVHFPWLDAFYSHEPLYFAVAAHREMDVRFQLSLKYQLWTSEPGVSKELADNWLAPDGVYFSYTQTSLWDIMEESSPFRDTSYKPALFWQERDIWFNEGRWGRARLSATLGFEHESNGRAEPQSRSINLAVFRPSLGYVSPGEWRFLLSPKVYAYLEKDDNADIDQFRGYVDLLALVRMPDDGLQLSLLGRLGSEGTRGSVQADLTYPLRGIGMPGYLLVQGFHGYGETLLEYSRRAPTQVRIGFSAIR
jgi:outer membrane phospholipase A